MRKIPTVFVRDPATKLRYVLDEVHPECKWVLEGEGVATRKYDGTCVMLDGHGVWWARREVKPGKEAPPGFDELAERIAAAFEPIGESTDPKRSPRVHGTAYRFLPPSE